MRGVLYAGSSGSTIGQRTQGTLGKKFTLQFLTPKLTRQVGSGRLP